MCQFYRNQLAYPSIKTGYWYDSIIMGNTCMYLFALTYLSYAARISAPKRAGFESTIQTIESTDLSFAQFVQLYIISTVCCIINSKSSAEQQNICFFFFFELLRRTTVAHSLSFQNSICLYPAGKRKELGLLDSKGFSWEIKSWHTSNTHLLALTSGFYVNKTKKEYYGGWGRVLRLKLTEQYADSSPYVLNSPPETERTATESIWFPHSRIKPSTCMWFNFILSSSISQKACLIYLTATKWSGQSPALRLSLWHVNGQPHHRRCDRGGKCEVYRASPPCRSTNIST